MTGLLDQLQRTLTDEYVLEREIGRGGMATVFLARDTRHQRNVALKVLDPELGAVLGGERFLSEIRVTANLQHPNLLPLFDSGQAGGLLYYVMPFVEGESLRARLDREKQIPVDDAVRIATAVANALDYAHAHGVIHRDLKPENILLQHGQPVVADFGIALAVSNAGGTRVTQTGLSLGTPQYMSPEQATGDRVIDGRTDIYSLAAVTYEMLTGEPPHTGTSAQAIIAKLMTTTPQPVRILRPSVPSHVAMAVERGLAKLPADRFGSARTFAEALVSPAFVTDAATTASGSPVRQPRRLATALGALAVAPLAIALWEWARPEAAKPVARYVVALDSAADLAGAGRWGRLALSPDGSILVYVGGPVNGLMLRRRDQLEATLIPGTEQAATPEFSPDGTRIAFIQNGRTLMIATLDGDPPIAVTDTLLGLYGISWSGNDTLVADGRGSSPLVRVAARAGARPELVSSLDSSLAEIDHWFPEVLPTGHVLYQTSRRDAEPATAVLDPQSGARRVIVEGARRPRYASGHLLYITMDGTLMAIPFDLRRQTIAGAPVVVGTGLATASIAADVAVSANGPMAYIATTESRTNTELIWVSRQGKVAVLDTTWHASLNDPALSPDGTKLAISATTSGSGGTSDVWITPINSPGRLRISVHGGRNRYPVWTKNGKHLLYATAGATHAVMEYPADGSAPPTPRVRSDREISAITAMPDGEWIVFSVGGFVNPRLYKHHRGDSSATRVFSEESPQMFPALSPDGRFLSFTIFDGRFSTTHVAPFPNPGAVKWQISPNPAIGAIWSNTGRELFYRDLVAGTVNALPVTTNGAFSVGDAKVLFPTPSEARFAVANDANRFLMIRTVSDGAGPRNRLTMIENWVEGLSHTNRP